MQQSHLSSSSAGFRPRIQIHSPNSATPSSASVVFGALFSGGAPFSFVSPTGGHASSDSSRSRTILPVSSLFVQPAFNVTITPTDCSYEPGSHYDLGYDRAAECGSCGCCCHDAGLFVDVYLVATCCSCRAVYYAVDCIDRDSRDSLPERADLLDFGCVVGFCKHSHYSRRRKVEPHSRGTQQKRTVCKQASTEEIIVLDSFGETHATVPTTENTAAASTTVSSKPNLLTVAEYELMRVRVA